QAVVPAPDGGYPNFTTAEGTKALQSLTTGQFNTAVGWYSLFSNAQGSSNTATGAGALLFNTVDENTAFGAVALLNNNTGFFNTAVGFAALVNNSGAPVDTPNGGGPGSGNTAVGDRALASNTIGSFNAAVGMLALYGNSTGNSNTALGTSAGVNITGSGNVCIGQAVSGEAGVGDSTYIRNVNTLAQNFSAGVNDYVTVRLSDGRLGHTAVVSSQRYKQDIKPLATTSEALYALKPVSFRLKKEFDPARALGFGLIAEEVEKVHPALVYRNDKGQVESVRYEMVNAMLLNEFLKEHREVAELKSTVAEQRKGMDAMAAQLKEQAAQIQKVSARLAAASPSRGGLEASKFVTGPIRGGGPAPQVVNNPQTLLELGLHRRCRSRRANDLRC